MANYDQDRDRKNPYSDLTTYVKKRKGAERRQRPTSLFSGYLFTGRRREIRRGEEEGGGYFVDRFSLADWIPPVALLLVSFADLILTSIWMRAGGSAANPLMSWLAGQGGIWFAVVKIGVAIFAAAFFLLHARFRSARLAIGSLIFVYSCLLAYHGYQFGLIGADPAGAVASLAR